MSGLLFAGDGDFFLSQTANGNKMLCTKINGPVLVLFYSTQCNYCKKLIPIFKKLVGTIGQCSFAMVNIGKARQVIKDSTFTKNPIEYVPFIIFYVNNKPFFKYKGPPEASEIQKFTVQVCNSLNQKFVQPSQGVSQGNQPAIPQQGAESLQLEQYQYYDENGVLKEYTTTGTPLYGDDDDEKCYLNFDDAYDDELQPGQKGDIRNSSKHHKKWGDAYVDVPYENYKAVNRKHVNPFVNRGKGKGPQTAQHSQMASQRGGPPLTQQQIFAQMTQQQRGQQLTPQQQQMIAQQMASQMTQQQMGQQHPVSHVPRQAPPKVSQLVHQQMQQQQLLRANQQGMQQQPQRGPPQQQIPQQQMGNPYAQAQRALYSHPTNTMNLGKGKASASGRRNANRR
jgi:thiol-disulfide isomerase/thioredoxin